MPYCRIVISLALTSLALVQATTTTAKPYELTFQNMHPPTNVVQPVFQAWIKEVEERSNGQLILHMVDNSAITTHAGAYDGVRDGTVDIGAFMPTYHPNELPYSSTLNMPFLTTSALDSLEFFYKAYEALPELKAELNRDVKFLGLSASGHSAFLSTKGQVLTMADLHGKRIIVWTPDLHAEMISAWGGNPLWVAVTDTYVGLQRGMGDIVYFMFPNARPLKLNELAKGVTLFYDSNNPAYIAINWDVWNMLPEHLQTILEETAGYTLSRQLCEVLHQSVLEDMAAFEAEGIPITLLTEEALAPFKQAALEGRPMEWWKEILTRAKVADLEGWISRVYALAAVPR